MTNKERIFPRINGRGVTVTEADCPMCAKQRTRNLGGSVPKLRIIDGETRPFCIGLHGYITDAEMR